MARSRRRTAARRMSARGGPDPSRPSAPGTQRAVLKYDGRWIVRPMSGAATQKSYRCPGCQQLITPGTPHQVVWPDQPSLGSAAGTTGLDERRHWHTSCWERRR